MKRLWLLGGLVFLGCPYTFNPSAIPGHIKTMEIPVLGNETLEVSLAEELTTSLTDRFVRDNTLQVVQGDADAVLEGNITKYENRVFGFNSQERADEYIVVVLVDMTFRDRVKNNEIWNEEGVVGRASYFVGGSSAVNTEAAAREIALKQITDFALSKTVEGW